MVGVIDDVPSSTGAGELNINPRRDRTGRKGTTPLGAKWIVKRAGRETKFELPSVTTVRSVSPKMVPKKITRRFERNP